MSAKPRIPRHSGPETRTPPQIRAFGKELHNNHLWQEPNQRNPPSGVRNSGLNDRTGVRLIEGGECLPGVRGPAKDLQSLHEEGGGGAGPLVGGLPGVAPCSGPGPDPGPPPPTRIFLHNSTRIFQPCFFGPARPPTPKGGGFPASPKSSQPGVFFETSELDPPPGSRCKPLIRIWHIAQILLPPKYVCGCEGGGRIVVPVPRPHPFTAPPVAFGVDAGFLPEVHVPTGKGSPTWMTHRGPPRPGCCPVCCRTLVEGESTRTRMVA